MAQEIKLSQEQQEIIDSKKDIIVVSNHWNWKNYHIITQSNQIT